MDDGKSLLPTFLLLQFPRSLGPQVDDKGLEKTLGGIMLSDWVGGGDELVTFQ